MAELIETIDEFESAKLSQECVKDFLESKNKGQILYEKIETLTKLAFHKNKKISNSVLKPVFIDLFGSLKKSFEKRDGEVYLKIFPYFILAARERSPIVDKWFKEIKISESSPRLDLYERSLELRKDKQPLSEWEKENIKKAIVLSRNTIGAEAYINGIVNNRILESLKNAEIVFVDSSNVGENIFNHPRIKCVREFENSRSEKISLLWNRESIPILERFEYTANLAEFIKKETSNLKKNEFMVLDIDTRLSQTGAMPICDNSNHYFLDTTLKNYDSEEVEPFGVICNDYFNYIFRENSKIYPKIFLKDDVKKSAKNFRNTLPENKKIILMHFGSGLKSKTLSEEVERRIILESFSVGTPLIVKPTSDWEIEKFDRTIKFLELEGKQNGKDFFTFKGSLASFVSLIGEVDICISYDSQCQHMAASQGIPFITIFTGHINKIFLDRWTPISQSPFKIIEVKENSFEENFLVQSVIDSLRKIIR